MSKIVMDTNFILSALRFRIKFPRGELIVPSVVINELTKISKSRSAKGSLAHVALQFVEKINLTIVRTQGNTDKAILNYAAANNCKVATNDKKLIKALKANNIKVIRIRQKKRIVEE